MGSVIEDFTGSFKYRFHCVRLGLPWPLDDPGFHTNNDADATHYGHVIDSPCPVCESLDSMPLIAQRAGLIASCFQSLPPDTKSPF